MRLALLLVLPLLLLIAADVAASEKKMHWALAVDGVKKPLTPAAMNVPVAVPGVRCEVTAEVLGNNDGDYFAVRRIVCRTPTPEVWFESSSICDVVKGRLSEGNLEVASPGKKTHISLACVWD
jgi:hypothetical protein